jgi:cyclopropane-fatty-acyl-phospholipid synthase
MSIHEAATAERPAAGPLTLRLLARLLDRLETGTLDLEWRGTRTRLTGARPGPGAELRIERPGAVLRRVAAGGDIGFAEAYMAGDWDSPDPAALLGLLTANEAAFAGLASGSGPSRVLTRLLHLSRRNSRRGSRRNIAYHYDLGNPFYWLWLDPSMTYSCALFEGPEDDLETAQARKYARLLDLLDAGAGQHILEIGCGWGGMAMEAARRGHRLTGITLSREQLDWARRRVERAGISGRVDLRLQDYRDVGGKYDHIVSVEMLEAVGEAYWPVYMRTLRERLRPGGRAALQVITIDEGAFDGYRRGADFIQRYIFPGGMLPSVERLTGEAEAAGLRVRALDRFGDHYARTLAEWHRRFVTAADEVRMRGFDERFIRMWRYYLAYCEAGFRQGRIDLVQVALEHA